jgi:hypothetical protein
LHLAAGAAMVPALPRMTRALDYPTRLVRIVVGYPAGGPTDIVARVIEQALSERLNRSFIADRHPPESEMQARLYDLGGTVIQGTPADFGILIFDETEKRAKVVNISGARAD